MRWGYLEAVTRNEIIGRAVEILHTGMERFNA